MGKKVKKKARSVVKEKRNPLVSENPIDQKSSQITETPPENGQVTNVKDRIVCPHVDKGIDVEKVSAKLGSDSVRCEDCREGAADRRASRTKGKHGKKKGGGGSKQDSKAIWICLECGHFSCGGAGFPTTPQSHAVRHAKQYHHPLAVQLENPQLRWCFPCNTLIRGKKAKDGSEQKDVFQEIVQAIKRRPSEGPTADVEAVWFGSGSVISEMKSEASVSVSIDGKGYRVRGLVNLGNTCFFNSILQNILAMNRLRDYFFKLDDFAGPLTTALMKFIIEANTESSLKSSLNPKSLFGSICAKAPQFRGYQQQDSHELLRCLLDRLCTEELTARKQTKSSQEGGKSVNPRPTFVDDIFGGRLSSTVSCLECGHSSVVHEPFLDLSLPLPSKRPPSKGAQSAFRARKSKPPKRNGKVRPKVRRDAASYTAQSAQGNGEESFISVQSVKPDTEGMPIPSVDASLDSVDVGAMAEDMGFTPQDLCCFQKPHNEKSCEDVTMQTSVNSLAWLDYLDPEVLPNGDDTASQFDHNLTNQASETQSAVQPADSMQYNLDADKDKELTSTDKTCSPDDLVCVNNEGHSKSPNCDIASEFSKKLQIKESGITDGVNVQHGSASCSQICSADSNLGTDSYMRLSEDEAPLQLQDSDILLLPYIGETSTAGDIPKGGCELSSAAEQDPMEFGGLGDLFNEPEPEVCNTGASEAIGLREVSSAAAYCSESDPEEVDNTDAPVSVESCLAYFTKPELLSKTEHAWQCENCTKMLKEQRILLKNKLLKPRSHDSVNGYEDKNANDASPSGARMGTHNGSTEKDTSEIFDDGLLFQKETRSLAEKDSVSWLLENGTQESHIEADNPTNSNFQLNKVQLVEASLDSAKCESKEGVNEETDVRSVKAERDATKRILIDNVPPILTIHLKRFSQDARGRLSKLSGHVNFREIIDLKPYLDSRCLQRETYKYNLIGVVEHSGTMRGGHYVAYVRGGPKNAGKDMKAEDFVWYHASDAYVREVSLEEVLRSEAYILFYEEA